MTESKELIPTERKFIPEVVDETGRKIVGPEMEAVTKMVIQLAQLAQLARIRKSLEKEEFEGKVDTITLSATDEQVCFNLLERWHYTPLITAFIINDGPDSVKIAINDLYPWMTIKLNETRTVDHTKADRRIERIYYKCDSGESASVRVEGEY